MQFYFFVNFILKNHFTTKGIISLNKNIFQKEKSNI